MSSGSSTTATRRARSSGFLARCHRPWPIALHVVSIPASKSSSSRRSRERRSRCRCPSTPATTLLASRTTSAAPAGAWTSDSEIVTLSGWSADGQRMVSGWSADTRTWPHGLSSILDVPVHAHQAVPVPRFAARVGGSDETRGTRGATYGTVPVTFGRRLDLVGSARLRRIRSPGGDLIRRSTLTTRRCVAQFPARTSAIVRLKTVDNARCVWLRCTVDTAAICCITSWR